MAQLQWMEANFGARLDYLTNKMCQVNTHVRRIAHRQAHLSGFAPSPPPSLEASTDEDEDASSSSDDKMTTSQ